jgi:hypothetical protein
MLIKAPAIRETGKRIGGRQNREFSVGDFKLVSRVFQRPC